MSVRQPKPRPTKRVLAILLLLLAACAGEERSAPGVASPIVLVGIDGLEWDVLLPLLAAGRMPNLALLMERGHYGFLDSMQPTLSPVVWTTVATAKTPDKHGILHFVRQDSGALYQSQDRRTKAIWDIVSDDADRRVHVIGWWLTWPVDPVRGVMVAQTNTPSQLDTGGGRNVWKGALHERVPRQVHPPDREQDMLAVLREVGETLPARTRSIFGAFPHPLSTLDARLWSNCEWAFRADATYLEIALRLASERPPADLTMVYFGGPDVVGHRFWRYHAPHLYDFRPTVEQIENFGQVLSDYYAYIDGALGKLVAAHGREATFLIVSDHGMRPVNQSARFDPDDPPADVNSAEHQDAPPGVFVAAGPPIAPKPSLRGRPLERRDLSTVGSVYDLTPTILGMLRIPLGRDFDGELLVRIFTDEARIREQPRPVPTHDTPEFLASRGSQQRLDRDDEQRREQLRSLGYID